MYLPAGVDAQLQRLLQFEFYPVDPRSRVLFGNRVCRRLSRNTAGAVELVDNRVHRAVRAAQALKLTVEDGGDEFRFGQFVSGKYGRDAHDTMIVAAKAGIAKIRPNCGQYGPVDSATRYRALVS